MDRNGGTNHNVSSTPKKRGFEGCLSILSNTSSTTTTSQDAKRTRASWNNRLDEVLISLVDSHNKTIQDSSPNLTLAKSTIPWSTITVEFNAKCDTNFKDLQLKVYHKIIL